MKTVVAAAGAAAVVGFVGCAGSVPMCCCNTWAVGGWDMEVERRSPPRGVESEAHGVPWTKLSRLLEF